MAVKWCHNAKTGEIFSYNTDGAVTDFPRGELIAYGDFLTTGFKSEADAREWAGENGACDKCRSSKKPNADGKCPTCGSDVKFTPVEVIRW